MSKIVQAINAMIANPDFISNVEPGSHTNDGDEYYFCYRGKYIWSVFRREDGEFWMYYYPKTNTSREAANANAFSDIPVVVYGESDLRSREGKDSVGELFMMLRGKLYNIDAVLDDIISDDTDF